MCGLAGAMSCSLSNPELDIFKDLLNVASLRGAQGAGVAVVNASVMKAPTIKVLKTKHIAGALAYSDQFTELLRARTSCVIGHARFPTRGGLEEDSVHPHRFGHIVGVHNGTMHRVAGQEVKDQSDSAMLFKAISEVGVVEAIKGSTGAYALVWADEKEGTLNFLRNTWRPLYFKNVGWGDKNINTLFWSSEAEMLDFVFQRSYKGTNTWDTYLPTDTWYQYPLETKHLIKPRAVIADVRPTPPAPTPIQNGSRRGATGRDWDDDDLDMVMVWDYTINEYRCVPRAEREAMKRGSRRGEPFAQDELPWAGVNRVLRLPPPDVAALSKSAQRRYTKALKEEERQAVQRLNAFRRAHELSEKKRKREEKEKDIRPALSELVDDSRDYSPSSPVVADHVDRGVNHGDGSHKRELRAVGKCCSWCSEPAKIGESVFLTNNDLGCKDFICWDCGTTNSAAAAYTADARTATIVN